MASWLEGCRFPREVSYIQTDAIVSRERHPSWSLHSDWVLTDVVSLPIKGGKTFQIPSIFLCRAYPGSTAIIDEQIRYGYLGGSLNVLL